MKLQELICSKQINTELDDPEHPMITLCWLRWCRCECPDRTALPGAAIASSSRLCRAHAAVWGGNGCGFGVGSDSPWG